MSSALIPTYKRMDVSFSHGKGAELFDESGRRYLDALSGIAVCSLGHAHPRVASAVAEQAQSLLHTSNLYRIPRQEELAQRLAELSGMRAAFFCNSGAEANEAAIKVARAYGNSRGIEMPEIVVANGSFHGRTLATLSATGNPKVHAGFAPLVSGFVHVPYDDVDSVRAALDAHPSAVAVFVEPVLGEGGVQIPAPGYLRALRALCTEHNALLMLDEVQTGVGRTGKWFAFQHEDILPDVMTLAKALGNGVPIGACLVAGAAEGALGPGTHGSTFGGNPMSCAAALAVLNTIDEEQLLQHATEMGQRLHAALETGLAGLNCVVEVRSKGLMVGVELSSPCSELVERALHSGYLINVTADRVVRLLPPLILTPSEIDELADGVCTLIKDWNAGIAA